MVDAKVDDKPDETSPGAGETEKKAPDGVYWESEAKKIIRERDEAKAKLRAIEESQEVERKKRLEETQNYKQELEKVSPELEELRKYRQAQEDRTKAKLEESEKALPAEHREEYDKFIAKLDAESRIEWISLRLALKPAVGSSPGNARPGNNGKPTTQVKEMSWEDRLKLAKEDPESFRKLV